MKRLILSAAVAMMATGAFAQTTTSSSTMSGSDVRFGLKAGVNLSKMHASGFSGDEAFNDAQKNNIGFSVTGYGDFGVANNFFIQPGISLQNKGTKTETTVGNVTSESTINTMYVGVPLNAVLRIPTGNAGAFQISAGPYLDFAISGKNKTEVTGGSTAGSSETDIDFGSSTSDDLGSMDFGANFGVGYRMNNGFTLGANYGLGLMNQIPKDSRSGDTKLTNRVLGFTVGYSF